MCLMREAARLMRLNPDQPGPALELLAKKLLPPEEYSRDREEPRFFKTVSTGTKLLNALVEQDDHAKRAVFAALEMQKRVKRLNEEWADEGFPEIRIGVGIHTGNAVVGNVGPKMRMDYTAIGATVSLASRVEGLTKDFATEIIITRDTLEQLDGLVDVKPLGLTEIRGIDEPVEVFDVLGFTGAEAPVGGGESGSMQSE